LPGYGVTILVALALGIAGSVLLARRLKRQIFGLEPFEIAGLLEEREASLQGIREGALATDAGGTITLANAEARRLLDLPADAVGKKVAAVLPAGRLASFLSGGLNDEDEVVLAGERLLERIGDPVLGALLLAKAAVASERGIELRVSDDTVLSERLLEGQDLITLVGNLIDNALDAAAASKPPRWVAVTVTQQESSL